MNWEKELYPAADEQPLDRLVEGYSNTAIFRKIAFIGDSLSSGEFENRTADGKPGYHDMFEYSWGQYIARKNGLTAYNFSRGGMTTQEYIESFAEEKGFWDPALACQAYVIALGVNDMNQIAELGTLDDIHPTDPSKNKKTFLGYYAAIIARYKKIAPDAKFFLVCRPDSDKYTEEERARKITGINRVLYDLASYFDKTYIIDLCKYGPIYDKKFQEHYYLYGHLNPAGYILTAKMVDSYIDYIIRHNPDDFRYVGFINTGIPY